MKINEAFANARDTSKEVALAWSLVFDSMAVAGALPPAAADTAYIAIDDNLTAMLLPSVPLR